jgi:hypothetical protein
MNVIFFLKQKGSPYMEEVNSWIMLMLQMGFHEQWVSSLLPNASSCATLNKIVDSHGNKNVMLLFSDTQVIFAMTLLGLAASILCFIFEKSGQEIIQLGIGGSSNPDPEKL